MRRHNRISWTLLGLTVALVVPEFLPNAFGDIFVVNYGPGDGSGGGIGKYTNAGQPINANLIPNLVFPFGITASATDIYVANGNICEFSTSGATINNSLISDPPSQLTDVTISGSDLYTVSQPVERVIIGKYTLSGQTIDADLVPGSADYYPLAIASSGSDLFVSDPQQQRICEYTTSGQIVNENLITGLTYPLGIAISGDDLFVVDRFRGSVGEYTTSGQIVNANLISGLHEPIAIAAFGSDLFVTEVGTQTVGEYTTTGETVNASLITGLNTPYGIAVTADVPEPSLLGILTLSGAVLALRRQYHIKRRT